MSAAAEMVAVIAGFSSARPKAWHSTAAPVWGKFPNAIPSGRLAIQPTGVAVASLSDRSDRAEARFLASRRCQCCSTLSPATTEKGQSGLFDVQTTSFSLGARQRVAIALIAAFAAAVFTIQLAGSASAAAKHHRGKHRGQVATHTGSATGLGQLSGLLPRNKLTLETRSR